MSYTSLEQRMAHNYFDLFPAFVPDVHAPVSEDEQRQFHQLMHDLYQLAFDEPLLFVTALHEDDVFPDFAPRSSYGKPKLITDMKKFTKAVDALIQKMYLMGQSAEVKLSKREQVILSRLSVDVDQLPAAWVWMATRENSNLISFKHCLFDAVYPYTSELYAKLLGESAFKRLEQWMLERGYQRFDIHDTTASDCKLSLSIVNPKWSKDRPSGGFQYKVRHTGIAALHDHYARHPGTIGLCIPNGFKLFLEHFDSMDEALRQFVIECTKTCDGCRYCVQTDKTGSRPLAHIPVTFEGKTYALCPYFPGYWFCWTQLDDELVDKLTNMLAFMDRFGEG